MRILLAAIALCVASVVTHAQHYNQYRPSASPDFDCLHTVSFVANLQAGTRWYTYADAGFMAEHWGMTVGWMQYRSYPYLRKTGDSADMSAYFASGIISIWKLDTKKGWCFRGSGKILGGTNRTYGGTLRLAVGDRVDNVMVMFEGGWVAGWRIGMGLNIQFY